MKASARPLEGHTRRERQAGEARVATRCSKRFYGLLSHPYQTQTNVWDLYRCLPCPKAGGHPSVSQRRQLVVGLGAGLCDNAPDDARGMREAPFPLPPTVGDAGVPPNFSSTFCGICKLAN